MKVVIDTNIVVDAIYENINNCLKIMDLAGKGNITPVVSQDLEKEYNLMAGKVLLKAMKDEFKNGCLKDKHFDIAQEKLYKYHELINGYILKNAVKVPVKSKLYISPDKDDNKIINLAVDSNSSCIITKNVAHFRCVEQQSITNNLGIPIKIMTPKQFNYYYMEHQAEIAKETERVNIVEKYMNEFKQAKYWSYEDAKTIDNINTRSGKTITIEQLRYYNSRYFKEINRLKDTINNINNTAAALKDAEGLLLKYDHNINTVEAYENAKLLKPVSKADYEFAKNEMSVVKGLLVQHGIKDKKDYNTKLSQNNQDKAKLPELENALNKYKGLQSMFARAVGVINKAVEKDVDSGKDFVKAIIKDIDIDR